MTWKDLRAQLYMWGTAWDGKQTRLKRWRRQHYLIRDKSDRGLDWSRLRESGDACLSTLWSQHRQRHWKPKKCVTTTTASAVQFTWVYKFRSQALLCLGKYPSKSCFSKPAAREGSPVSLVLNSCCAHCDKIERGIERDRLHNQPVFHNAEPNLPAATLFEIWIWIHQVQIQLGFMGAAAVSL